MDNLARINKEKIDKFNLDLYLKEKNFQMASAISALRTTNLIQLSFLKEEDNLGKGDYALRLYALLQALFVSIDSLYAIAYALTRSKSFININANPDLRVLKYIRNDVVGHPANRVVNSDDVAFCILDDNSISKKSFDYYVYTKEETTRKVVLIDDILESYYKEANDLLDNLYEVAKTNKNVTLYEELIDKIITLYMHDTDYKPVLNKLIEEYKKQYPDPKISQHRILWRYNVINKLNQYEAKNNDEKDVVNYCVGIELFKLYELVNNTKYSVSMNKKNPKYISALFRMLNRNPDLVILIDYLKNSDHPLFYSSLCRLYNAAVKNDNKNVCEYLKMIKKAYSSSREELLYGLSLPFRKYIRK